LERSLVSRARGREQYCLTGRKQRTEVGDDGVAVVERDVLGLHVAMHHAMTVRLVEGLGDLARQAQCLVDRQLRLAVEPIAE
jgi:hypothetical protein